MARTRADVPEKEKWNVEAFFKSPVLWKEAFNQDKGQEGRPRWPDLKNYEGHLASPDKLRRFFDAYFDLQRKLGNLYVYAQMRLDEDLGNDSLKENFGRAQSLLHDFQLEFSWVEPELLSLKEGEFHALLHREELAPYRVYLERIGRMRPHTLTPALEEMVALTGKALLTPMKAFGALNNADMTFEPAVTSQGEKKDLTNGTYLSYMRDKDRTLRRTAYENLHKGFQAHLNTLTELLQGHVQGHLFHARAKKFKDCREAALFNDHIDPAVYDRLLSTIHENLAALHEYVGLRKQLMGLSELHPYDLYAPLVADVQMKLSYPEACQLVLESVEPLGASYAAVLKKGLLEDRWVDPYENHRKRSGAYSSGCYDSMPYILMNFHGTLNDTLTLAHEAGHSMHSHLSNTHQPYIYSDTPIFVAEVASTFNEQLLLSLLKKRAKNESELAYLINYQIEGIRATIFRQALFAEFELAIHRLAEQGTPLTPSLLNETYLKLNRAYYGPELVLDCGIECEWARIPHFYSNFYVYQYATGLSAALTLFEQAMQSNEAKDRYLHFLASGSCAFPLDLLKTAGVDLREKTAVDTAMKRFKALVGELKKLLQKKSL